jgi:hypothetical protein
LLNLTIRTAENTGIFIPDPNHTSWFLAPGDAFFRIAIISQPHKGSHRDILVHFPFLQRLLVVDSYYYALAFEFLGKLETKTVQPVVVTHFALEGTNRLLIPVILDVAVVDSAELSVCF